MMAINTCLVHLVEGAGGASGSDDEGEELSMQDTPIIAGLLEVLVILWEGAKESLAKVGCQEQELAELVKGVCRLCAVCAPLSLS